MEVDGAWQVVCFMLPTFPAYGFHCALAKRVIGARIIGGGCFGGLKHKPGHHT